MNIVEFFAERLGLKVSSYSGRGMYGDQTLAFTVDDASDLGRFISDIMENAADMDEVLQLRVKQWCQHMRWDSMGMGMVFYSNWFPMTDEEVESLESYECSDEEGE